MCVPLLKFQFISPQVRKAAEITLDSSGHADIEYLPLSAHNDNKQKSLRSKTQTDLNSSNNIKVSDFS